MDYVGRKGLVHWWPAGMWYEARVVSYDALTGEHTVVWLVEWTYSVLRLGGISSPETATYGFRPSGGRNRRSLLGKRIVLKPRSKPWFLQGDDYSAVVVGSAEDGSGYYVFYTAHRLIVTTNLRFVKYISCDATGEEIEVRNPQHPEIELDPPLMTIEMIHSEANFL